MFNPKFTCNDEIKDFLKEIELIKKFILESHIEPEIDISLKKEAVTKTVYASTAISDEKLVFDDVRKILSIGEEETKDKRERKPLNYYKVLENIDNYHENGIITEKLLLEMHKQITKNLLDDTSYEGWYRDIRNYVEDHETKEIRYTPPYAFKVRELTKNLIDWINKESYELPPVIVAGIVHYELVRIHPFVNGNGRTARALATLILCSRSFDMKRYFALDEYYNEDRKAYGDALKSADDTDDLTEWLKYFTEGFLISVSDVKKLISDLPKIDDHITLTEDQIKIVRHIHKNRKITNKQTQKLLEINEYMARKKLKELESIGIIKIQSKGPSTHYIFTPLMKNEEKC